MVRKTWAKFMCRVSKRGRQWMSKPVMLLGMRPTLALYRIIIWNAVFYEPVSQCSSSWRKRRRWTDNTLVIAEQNDKYNATGLMVEQERHKKDKSFCEADYPPSFGPELKSSNIQAQQSVSDSSHLGVLMQQSTSCANRQANKNVTKFRERVENALHLSVQSAVYEYFKNIFGEEFSKADTAVGDEKTEDYNHTSRSSCQTIAHGLLDEQPGSRTIFFGGSRALNDIQTDAHPLSSVSLLEESSSSHTLSSFERLSLPIVNVNNLIESDEPPPPGTEDSLLPTLASQNSGVISFPILPSVGAIEHGVIQEDRELSKKQANRTERKLQNLPAGETEFAKDASFVYTSSNLCEWVEERTRGRVLANSVASISIQFLRKGGPIDVCKHLCSLQKVGTVQIQCRYMLIFFQYIHECRCIVFFYLV